VNKTSAASQGALVIADDLTSAAEAGGHAASVGRRATVVVWDAGEAPDCPSAGPDQDLIQCLDLNTRALDAASAARAHATALGMVDVTGRMIYKTVDSSLRGNWAEEIAATLTAVSRRICVLAPAYPEFDRQTRSGVQFVSGVPTDEGPAGSDPIRPVTEARIWVPLAAAGLDVVRVSSEENLSTVLTTAAGASKGVRTVVVVDASTPEHLSAIAGAVQPFASKIVVAGSPGLFEALLPTPALGSLNGLGGRGSRTLTAVGSLHPSSRAQVQYLERRGMSVVTADADTRASTLTSELDAILEARGHAVVVTSPSSDGGPSPLPAMSEAVANIACERRDVGLVLVGGDTARSVLRDAKVRATTARGVVTSGVPVLQLTLPLGRCQVITKAGGFGDPSLLHLCIQALTEGVS
jgi:4-hydroxythreonine-4-phosphate dehydrogenase